MYVIILYTLKLHNYVHVYYHAFYIISYYMHIAKAFEDVYTEVMQ